MWLSVWLHMLSTSRNWRIQNLINVKDGSGFPRRHYSMIPRVTDHYLYHWDIFSLRWDLSNKTWVEECPTRSRRVSWDSKCLVIHVETWNFSPASMMMMMMMMMSWGPQVDHVQEISAAQVEYRGHFHEFDGIWSSTQSGNRCIVRDHVRLESTWHQNATDLGGIYNLMAATGRCHGSGLTDNRIGHLWSRVQVSSQWTTQCWPRLDVLSVFPVLIKDTLSCLHMQD
jgi:hypothetical protein